MKSETKVYQYVFQPFFSISKREIPVEVNGCMLHNLSGYFYNMQSSIYEDRLHKVQSFYGRYVYLTTEEEDELAHKELLKAYKEFIDSKEKELEKQKKILRNHINYFKSIEKGE